MTTNSRPAKWATDIHDDHYMNAWRSGASKTNKQWQVVQSMCSLLGLWQKPMPLNMPRWTLKKCYTRCALTGYQQSALHCSDCMHSNSKHAAASLCLTPGFSAHCPARGLAGSQRLCVSWLCVHEPERGEGVNRSAWLPAFVTAAAADACLPLPCKAQRA